MQFPITIDSEGLFELIKYAEAKSLTVLTVVDCKGVWVGAVTGAGGEITALLKLNHEIIGSLEGDENQQALACEVTFDAGSVTDCKSGTVASVWVDTLAAELGDKWETHITLAGGDFDNDWLGNLVFLNPGFEVECESLFLGIRASELCEGLILATLSNSVMVSPAYVLEEYEIPSEMGSGLGFSDCSMTGEESGAIHGEVKTWALGSEMERLPTSVSDV